MTILIIVSSGLAAILTALFAIHKAGKARIANIVVTIILILFITGYSAVQEWKKERTRQTLLNDTYHRLFSVSQDLMALVRDATVQASDGWVPRSPSE